MSIFAVLNAWKDFLWPLIVLPEPVLQPLSVRLPVIRDTVELDVFLASLFISMLLPVTVFLVFQRLFLRTPASAPRSRAQPPAGRGGARRSSSGAVYDYQRRPVRG